MLRQIRELLEDRALREAMHATQGRAEAIELLRIAGAERGHFLTAEGVSGALAGLAAGAPSELSEHELLSVSGGRYAEDPTFTVLPKTCS